MTNYEPISLLILVLNKLLIPFKKITLKNKVRLINAEMIAKLQLLLSGESWDYIYNTDNIDSIFNSFHCTLLNIFENSFPVMYRSYRKKKNDWITNGIRISCKHKRNLFV
jgi:hypothetical protein